MKRILAAFMAAMLLVTLAGCKEAPLPAVEDVTVYARKESNTLAAEQGDWMVLRSEKDGAPGLLLYNKKEKTGRFLLEGAYKNPGLWGNRVYFQAEDTGDLYYFDLATATHQLLLVAVEDYQIRDGLLYYTVAGALFTQRLDLGIQKKVETGYGVDDFWITDYGVYYYTAEKQLLMVLPHGSDGDRIVCAPEGAVLDVVTTKGAHLAFIQKGEKGSKGNILCTFDPADRVVLSHLEGEFSALQLVGQKVVVAEGAALYAIDLSTDQKEDWGGKEADSVQFLSDCAVFYTGNESSIRFYPE